MMDVASILEPDPGFWTKTSWIQLGYGVWVSLTVLGVGMLFEFPAVTVPQLAQPGSIISVSISDESWIASGLTLSSPIGCLLSGFLMDQHGRRIVLLLCQMPMCIGWLFISFAGTARDIIIGRIISGVGFGMAFGAPRVYLTEITLPNMRGVVGAFPNIALSIGITLMAGLGSVLRWHVVCYICSGYTIALTLSNLFLPETPYFVLVKGTEEGAKKSLRKFRSKKYNVNAEMEKLLDFKLTNNIRRLSIKEQLKALFQGSACKPFGIVGTYMLFMQMAGVSIALTWTIEMLEESKSSVEPHVGNFLLGMTRLFVGGLSAVLFYKIGRKIMALISAFGLGMACICLGSFIHHSNKATIFPQICYMAHAAFASLGYSSIPFIIMCELYPLQIRGILGGITISLYNLVLFATSFSFPYVKDALGFANTILGFGGISLLCFIYLYFYLPETKDLTLQEIEEYFKKRRPTLVSERQVISAQIKESKSMSAGFSQKSNLNMKTGKKNTRNIYSHNDNVQMRMSQPGEDDDPSTSTATKDNETLYDLSTNFKLDSETRDSDQSGSISRDKEKH